MTATVTATASITLAFSIPFAVIAVGLLVAAVWMAFEEMDHRDEWPR